MSQSMEEDNLALAPQIQLNRLRDWLQGQLEQLTKERLRTDRSQERLGQMAILVRLLAKESAYATVLDTMNSIRNGDASGGDFLGADGGPEMFKDIYRR